MLLAGLHHWQWVGILLARLAVGLLFMISGCGKLFRHDRRAALRTTLQDAHVPRPHITAVVVGLAEFTSGFLLVLGLLTPLACLLLSGVMVVALFTTQLRKITASSIVDWLGEFLYLPEVLYLVILTWLFFSGPGWLSVDNWLLSGAGS